MGWVIKVGLKTYPNIDWYVKSIKRDLSIEATTDMPRAKVYKEKRFFSKLIDNFDKNDVSYEIIEVKG